MYWDILLAITLVLVQAALAFLGFRVTLRPPATRLHPHYKVAFGGIAVTGVVLVLTTTIRTSKLQESVNDKLDQIKISVDKLSLAPSALSPAAKLLTDDETYSVANALKPFAASSVSVKIGCAISAFYPCQSAAQWLQILKAAGWNAHEPILSQMYMPPFAGVQIAVPTKDTQGAGLLQQAFKSVGIDAVGALDTALAPGEILIKFGLEH